MPLSFAIAHRIYMLVKIFCFDAENERMTFKDRKITLYTTCKTRTFVGIILIDAVMLIEVLLINN